MGEDGPLHDDLQDPPSHLAPELEDTGQGHDHDQDCSQIDLESVEASCKLAGD